MVKKAFLNKNVLSNFLKLSMFGAILTSRGKLFHKFEAATMKYLSPNVLYGFKINILKVRFHSNQNLTYTYPHSLILISSVIYPGAKPLIALYIKSKILNSMRNLTGSQCKLYNNGVILQYLDSLSINLAAAFWTVWIHHKEKKVITEEKCCLWMDNQTQKDEEKTRKYGPLR